MLEGSLLWLIRIHAAFIDNIFIIISSIETYISVCGKSMDQIGVEFFKVDRRPLVLKIEEETF